MGKKVLCFLAVIYFILPILPPEISAQTIQWQAVGPVNCGGETRAILVDRNNSNLVYAASDEGGLFV